MNGFLLRIAEGRWSWAGLAKEAGRLLAAHAPAIAAFALVLVVAAAVLVAWELPRRHVVRATRRMALPSSFVRAARHAGVAGADESGVTVRQVRATPVGHRMKVALPPGTHGGTLEDARDAIAAALGVREVRVVRDAANAGVAWVNVVRTDTLARPTPLGWSWLGKEQTSYWAPIPLGVDEDGEAVSVGMAYRNILVAGEPGGGKSVAVNLLTAAAALDPTVRITTLDGKLVELAVWRRCAEACVGVSVADANDVLTGLQAQMDERYAFLADAGKRKVEPGDGFSLSLIVVDELAHYCAGDDTKAAKEFAGRLRDLVSRGRAAGVMVIAATQKPSSDIIPTYLRDLFGFRLAFRCSTPQASDTILGQGWASRGFSATSIDAANRGVGLLLHEGDTPVRMRCAYLSDDDLASLAARAEALRCGPVAMPPDPDHALPDPGLPTPSRR